MCSAQAHVRYVPIADMSVNHRLSPRRRGANAAVYCRTNSIRLPCLYYFFLAVVVIRYKTKATARWALLFIVRAFFNDTITVAVWTGFHACASWDPTTPTRFYPPVLHLIRQSSGLHRMSRPYPPGRERARGMANPAAAWPSPAVLIAHLAHRCL